MIGISRGVLGASSYQGGGRSEGEAELYQEWIANDRQLRRLIQQMRQVAAKAAELRLRQAASQ